MLSKLSLEFIRTRFSKPKEVPQLNAEGFKQILNPLNWPIIDVTPPYLEIPDDLHSVQTLQFLGFQLASAKEIFDDFTPLEHENSNRMLGFVELAKIYLDAVEGVADTFTGTEGQGNISKVVTLTQVFMGLDLDGDRLEAIDPPDRHIFWNIIKDWVFEVLDCRYDFLRNLDSAILRREKAYWQLEEDEAAQKARNR